MTLPGAAAVPAADARRYAVADSAGARAVELAWSGLRPSHDPDAEAFDNAVVVLAALGGSTNAIIHLIAMAGRAGVRLPLERFDELAARTPLLVDLRPAGEHLFEQLFHAGGIQRSWPSSCRCCTPTRSQSTAGPSRRTSAARARRRRGGRDTRESLRAFRLAGRPARQPRALRGRAEGECSQSGAAPALGPGRDLRRHLRPREQDRRRQPRDRRALGADPAQRRPEGRPGMPEWGMLPIPQRLLARGVSDMVRISDARMSGTGFGTVVLHVSPEAADGGPLGAVEDGDIVTLDVVRRVLDIEVDDRELEGTPRRASAPATGLPPWLRLALRRAHPAGRQGLRLRFPRASAGRGAPDGPARVPAGLDRRLVTATGRPRESRRSSARPASGRPA